jgi:ABC-2 type transport system permease protein
MKEVLALYLAQAREFLRDRSSVFFVLLLPVGFGVFFSLVFSGGGGFTLQLGLANEDQGPAGTRFVQQLQSPEVEKMLALHTGSRAELLDALNKGDLSAVVVLPSDLSASLATGQTSTVDVFYDPTRPTSAGIGLGTVRTLLSEANLAISGSPRLFEMREQTMQTHPLRAVDFYMPGMLGVALLWLGIFGTAQPIVAQREAQVLRRWSVTPITRTTILAAEVGWRVTVSLMQTSVFLAVGFFGFGVGVQDWPLFIGAVLLGGLVFVTLGYVLTGVARTTDGVMAVAQLVNFPMMMLSGSFVSPDMLPALFKPVMSILPLTYLNDALRQAMVGAQPLYSLDVDFAVLGGWLLILLALAVRLWRWQ